MIVYIASCNDKKHTYDSVVISGMKNVPGIVDAFQNCTRIRKEGSEDQKFCIAAIAIGDNATIVRAQKIMEWMFPCLKEIRRLNETPTPD